MFRHAKHIEMEAKQLDNGMECRNGRIGTLIDRRVRIAYGRIGPGVFERVVSAGVACRSTPLGTTDGLFTLLMGQPSFFGASTTLSLAWRSAPL